MGYDFTIEYKRGCENKAADTLSKRDEIGEPSAFSQPVPTSLDPIKEEVHTNSQLQRLVQLWEKGEAVGPWDYKDGVLFFKGRIYMREDSPLIPTIISEIHGSTHEGYHKTMHRIRSIFYWKGMRSHIRQFIRQCHTCQRHKSEHLTPSGLLQPLPVPTQIWADISMDFIDGLHNSKGKTTIYVVVDRLSKYSHFIPVAHPYTAVRVAQVIFDQIFKLHGMPQSIVCDRDPTCTSIFWKEFFA